MGPWSARSRGQQCVMGGKVFVPGCASKAGRWEPVRSPKNRSGKNLDWCWTRRIFNLQSWGVEEIDSFSSSWKSTSRKWWVDWILEVKDNLQRNFLFCHHWSDEKWKKSMARRGGNKKRFQYCTDQSGQQNFLSPTPSRSFRTQSHWSYASGQCVNSGHFFEYIYHIGCAINLHSITSSGLIPGGQNSSRERQTVFFTAVDPMHKEHQDPYKLDLTQDMSCIVQAKVEKAQDTVYWVDIQLAQRKRLKFYQTRSNAIILYDSSLLYLESDGDDIWRNYIPEGICVTSTTTENFLQR